MSLFQIRGGNPKDQERHRREQKVDHDDEQYPRKEVEEFFDEMDRDFDGRLSFAEFMGEETPLEKLFKSMDKDGDGTVTKEEFASICKNLTKEQVSDAFSKFDSSGDDKLDYREFCTMIHSRKAAQK